MWWRRICDIIRGMKNKILLLASLVAAVCGGGVKETDWCTVKAPDNVEAGQSFVVEVTLKRDLADGETLSCQMHHTKTDGKWGGMYEWRPSQTPKKGETAKFHFTVRANKPAKALNPLTFIAPNGDFNKLSKRLDGPNIGYSAKKGGAAGAEGSKTPRPDTATFKKSWITITRTVPESGVVRKDGKVALKVKYFLDPSDNWGEGTKLKVTPLGPWIDNPDGVVNKGRKHVFIHGFWPLEKKAIPVGENEFDFEWTAQSASAPYCEIGFMAQFVGGDGKSFPWQTRGGGVIVEQETKGFRVWAESSGGLYLYDESPVVCVKFSGAPASEANVKLVDSEGEEVYSASLPVKDGKIAIPPQKRRGAMLCEVTIGKDTRSCFFATIPDVAKALGGKRAPFGCTNIRDEDAAKAAAKIGFRYCRLFTGWAGLEPKRGLWRLDGLDRQVDMLNANGISPLVLLTGAPEWALPPGVHSPGFEPFPFDEDGWREAATHLAKHYKGRIWGFEWLNEIVQGNKTPRPVEDYIRFCEIGTESVKKVDPGLQVQMAGGLWPRNFRLDVLRAGIAKDLDVLPVHYGSYDSVLQARGDFSAGGGRRVWDNESARGYSVWGMDPRKTLLDSVTQSVFVMRQWPGEFIAGAEAVVYFGGEANAAGNWTYLLDRHTPRPVAATLAVLATKLGDVRPVGAACLEPGAIVYLFEKKNGKGLAFVMSQTEKADVQASIPVGSVASVKVTDYRGNESSSAASGGNVVVAAKPMPVIFEDFDLAPLAAACSLTVAAQGPLVQVPSVRFVSGGNAGMQAAVVNPFARALSGTVEAKLGAAKAKPFKFSLKPGETAFAAFDFGPVKESASEGAVAVKFDVPGAVFTRRFSVSVVNPELLGNLVKNGGFEKDGGKVGEGWNANGMSRVELDGKAPGYVGHAVEMRNPKGYVSTWQNIALPVPGIRYLYTAWVWTDEMYCGSNASVKDAAGKGKDYTIPSCFCAPKKTKGWTLMSKVLDAIPGSEKCSLAPVGTSIKGQPGWARYDNVRLTAYDETEYVTEAYEAKRPPKIDGDLSDWDTANPVPLLCENQVTASRGGWEFSRENLSGVAYFAWDKEALYFAAEVKDDMHTTAADAKTPEGDSITLALHPGNRVPGTDGQAEEWFISDHTPGGGSGRYTLYRPAEHSAGLKSGQLAKDSSVYEVCVKSKGDTTVYELRIPWGEVRGITPELGAKLGLSLRLSDADGAKFGRISWGMGLDPAWSPSAFGVLTLVGPSR